MKKSSRSVESCFSRFKCLRRLVVAVRGRISSCNHPLQRSRGARNTSQNSFHGLEDELKSVRKGRETAWDLASAVLGACFGWLGLLRMEFRAATSRFRAAGVPKKKVPKQFRRVLELQPAVPQLLRCLKHKNLVALNALNPESL